MKSFRIGRLSLAVAMLWVVGCSKPLSAPPAPAPAAEHPGEPTQAQPRLSTVKLWIGPKEIVAEQAVTARQVQTGMMFRKEMGEDEGMIFVFSVAQQPSFWMRNTLIPLSLAYIDPAGTILEIHEMKPLDETSVPAKSDQVQFVLEMKAGWFERNKIPVGTVIRTERGTLQETYFRQ